MRRHAFRNAIVVLVFAGAMPALVFACSGNDPLLGFRQPQPRPDTGQRDNVVPPTDGPVPEGGEAGEAGDAMTDAPADTMMQDTGIDTGVGMDAADGD